MHHQADAHELAVALGSLPSLAGASLDVTAVGRSWIVTFGGVEGEVPLLSADSEGLSGGTVHVGQEVAAQPARHVVGSPLTV